MKYDINVVDIIKNYKISINKIDNIHTIEEFNLPCNIWNFY